MNTYIYSFANVVHLALLGGPMCVFHDKDTVYPYSVESDFTQWFRVFSASLGDDWRFMASNFPEDHSQNHSLGVVNVVHQPMMRQKMWVSETRRPCEYLIPSSGLKSIVGIPDTFIRSYDIRSPSAIPFKFLVACSATLRQFWYTNHKVRCRNM